MTTMEYRQGFVGQNVSIIRKDGRIFVGAVDIVRSTANGTLMVVNTASGHKSVYMEDMEDITVEKE